MANSYRYAELSDRARIEGLKRARKTLESYKRMIGDGSGQIELCYAMADIIRIIEVLEVKENG